MCPFFRSLVCSHSLYFEAFKAYVLRKFQGCFKEVSRVFQESFKGGSKKFQGSFKCVSRVFQGCFISVSRVFEESFEEILSKCFKQLSSKFQAS